MALTRDGVALGEDGFARILAPGDLRRGRWVSNLISLEVYRAAAVPTPPVWALLGAGVAARLATARRPLAGESLAVAGRR